jgi:hypothetical protein
MDARVAKSILSQKNSRRKQSTFSAIPYIYPQQNNLVVKRNLHPTLLQKPPAPEIVISGVSRISLLTVICLCGALYATGQSTTYVTSGGELIFSWANIEQTGATPDPTIRFMPVINLQSMLNKDVSQKFGLFTGLALRNVGFRMNNYLNPENGQLYEKAFRSYNIGVPIGIKLGNLDRAFLYAGYEIEMGFLYKEKTYENNDKIDKITGWFSDRQNMWLSSAMVGVQLPYGANIKFKYYLTDLLNQNYTAAGGVKPYAGLKANVLYVSLSFMLFKNADVYLYNE